MKDFISILSAVQLNPSLAESAALATLVKVTGSFYRHPGARMLITSQGATVGTVSGGCLEHDLMDKAEKVIKSGEPVLLNYDTAHPETGIGRALKGCGGDVAVMIQPIHKERLHLLAACIAENICNNLAFVLATVIRVSGPSGAKVGDQLAICGDKIKFTDINAESLADALRQEAGAIAKGGSSLIKSYTLDNLDVDIFIESFQSPTSVLIIGAGEIASSMATLANELGCKTIIVDHRPGLATKIRFPHSECITLDEPSHLSQQVKIDRMDAAVILTHICQADLEYMSQLISSALKYIGLLGSHGRVEGLCGQLEHSESSRPGQWPGRIYGPVGLDLGAESPPEIALSIVAEIKAVLSGRTAQSMKDRAKRTGLTVPT